MFIGVNVNIYSFWNIQEFLYLAYPMSYILIGIILNLLTLSLALVLFRESYENFLIIYIQWILTWGLIFYIILGVLTIIK